MRDGQFDDGDDDDEIAKAEGEMLAELVKEIVEAMVEAKAEEITAAVGAKIAALPKPNALDEANLQGQIRGFLRSAMSEELGAALTTVEQRIGDIAEKLQADLDQTDQTAAALGQNAVAAMNSAKAEIADLRGVVAAGSNLARTAGEAAQGAVAKVDAVKGTVDGFIADQKPPKDAYQIKALAKVGWAQAKRGWPAGTIVLHNGAYWLAISNTKPNDEPGAVSKVWLQAGLAFAGFVGATSSKSMRQAVAATSILYADTPPPAGPGNVPGGPASNHARFWVSTTDMRVYAAMQDAGGTWVWSQSIGTPA